MKSKERRENEFKRACASPDGQTIIKYLREKYVDKPTFVMGEDASNGFFRSGQCDVVFMIEKKLKQIEKEASNG